jgi:tRNA pseudouridine38-40 synthase
MPSFRITLAYDGTGFVGWQRQAAGRSIQGCLEDAVRALDEREVTVHGAGRTDAGVHALGQVASFTLERTLPCETVVRAINARLPDAIRVLDAVAVPDDFHPRIAARRKAYRYRIWNSDVMNPIERRYAWHVSGVLDVARMQAAAALIAGRHDFAAFQSAGSDVGTSEREIFVSRIADCGLRIDSGLRIAGCGSRSDESARLLSYDVVGDGFLRHMVRAIVGSLVEVGRGRRPVEWIADVLAARDRAAAGPTAPPEGLFLVSVAYDDALAARS